MKGGKRTAKGFHKDQSSLNRCRDHMYRDELPRGRVGARGAWGVPLTPAGRGKW